MALRNHWTYAHGWQVTIQSAIPMGKGVSSSSALAVGWYHLLSQLAEPAQRVTPHQLAEGGYHIEVEEFGEPGGKMDHYAVAYGGMLSIQDYDPMTIVPLKHDLPGLILGDSLKQKDTIGLLSEIKQDVQRAWGSVQRHYPAPTLKDLPLEEFLGMKMDENPQGWKRLQATLETRDLTREGFRILREKVLDQATLGALINKHHKSLRDHLGISTPLIETLRDAAMKAGALAAKISGSGQGGCFLVWAPGREEQVMEAIKGKGGQASCIEIDGGSKVWNEG